MTDRDELLRQIGEKVVRRHTNAGGYTDFELGWQCLVCGEGPPDRDMDAWSDPRYHADDCELTRYLEATDGG